MLKKKNIWDPSAGFRSDLQQQTGKFCTADFDLRPPSKDPVVLKSERLEGGCPRIGLVCFQSVILLVTLLWFSILSQLEVPFS